MKPSQLTALLSKTIPAHKPILIKGAPGVGKTDVVTTACEAAGANLIVSHPVVSDPIDFKGMPFVADGRADFLPFGDLRKLIEATTSTVFFLDDLGQAPPTVQAAAMQLILARRINGHQVADVVTFIAATNRKQDKAGVSGILEAYDTTVTVIYCDSAMQGTPETFTREDLPLTLAAAGGGGTDFRPPFKWVQNQGLEPACLIYLTDMDCRRYPVDPGFPVLWAKIGTWPTAAPPFGEVIEID